ncbi:MAG TPA: D-glycerate dehydrogenase [Candidatus Paceibacterota bacterium]
MATIFITRKIHPLGIEKLEASGHEVFFSEKEGNLTKEEFLVELQKRAYDAVLCFIPDRIDASVFDAAPSVKIFANYAVGFDNIDVAEAKRRGVIVTNTPDVLTNTVAEHTFALLLALAHRIVEADAFTRAGKYTGWVPELFLGNDMTGKTLGILGAGRIGTRVAYHGQRSFDMRVLYYDVKRNEHIEKETGAEFRESVEDVLKESDFVSVHVPLLESTRHLINKERLAIMKPSSYLVNTSRGPVVDEVALVEALQKKVIKGAALDVFEKEPALAPGLAELSNVIITPHIASATEETRFKMGELAADNLLAVLGGGEPLTPIRA